MYHTIDVVLVSCCMDGLQRLQDIVACQSIRELQTIGLDQNLLELVLFGHLGNLSEKASIN